MKMHCFAGALCASTIACASPVQAQSSITLYGLVDTNVEYTTHNAATGVDGKSKFALNSGGLSPSRWGLRGTENLGGGTRAIFTLEGGFNPDTGTSTQGGRLFGRQAWVGVEFGNGRHKLTAGRHYVPLFIMLAPYTPGGYSGYEPSPPFIIGPNLREDNAVQYQGSFGPVRTLAHWSFGEQPGTLTGSSGYGAGLEYAHGPFGIAVAYDNINSAKSGAGGYTRTRKAAVALRYQITDDLRAVAAYRYNRNDTAAMGPAIRDDLWWLGLNYQASAPLMLTAGAYYDAMKSARSGTGIVKPKNPWQFTFIATYALSKRTDVYLATAYARNSALNFETYNSQPAYAIAANAHSQTGVALGMRHRF